MVVGYGDTELEALVAEQIENGPILLSMLILNTCIFVLPLSVQSYFSSHAVPTSMV